MEKLDFKKQDKALYLPKTRPEIITVPKFNYLAVRGTGDPNAENSEYKASLGLLYAVIFTIKMSKMGNYQPAGYCDFVVPPLEGLWWQDQKQNSNHTTIKTASTAGIDYSRKDQFNFISMLRLPDFVTPEVFKWAIDTATAKKPQDFSKVEFFPYDEGACVQCLHLGPYDDEPATIKRLHEFAEDQGYRVDLTATRLHHEIYLSDPRKCRPDRLKTVIRLPIRKNPN